MVTYPAGPGFSRADVATRLVPDARDISGCLCDTDPATRKRAVAAAGALFGYTGVGTLLLSEAGARHHDLNVKNVLLRHRPDAGFQPYVLDVDRVTFHEPHDPDVIRGNAERLLRSARKWRRLHGARVTDAELTAWQARYNRQYSAAAASHVKRSARARSRSRRPGSVACVARPARTMPAMCAASKFSK